MNIAQINHELHKEDPEHMELRGISKLGRLLQLAFICHGGPRENDEFLVAFEDIVVFHMPAVFYGAVRFEVIPPGEVKQIIPETAYDESEINNPNGYQVFALTDKDETRYGYYIAAYSVSGKWAKTLRSNTTIQA